MQLEDKMEVPPPQPYKRIGGDRTGQQWTAWKAEFRVYLMAKGLDRENTPEANQRKVGLLLNALKYDGIKLYDTFEWLPAVPANGNQPAKPAEDKHDLETVLRKFDDHYSNKQFRSIRRQEFLDRMQNNNETIMDFIADLKSKIKDCDYGTAEDSLLVDRIMNGVRDSHVKLRLMDLQDDEQTLNNVIRICRNSELSQSQVKAQDINFASRNSRGRNYQRFNGRSQGFRPRGRYGYGSSMSIEKCEKCEKRHNVGECQATDRFCGTCGQKGHFARSRLCQGQAEGGTHSYQNRSYQNANQNREQYSNQRQFNQRQFRRGHFNQRQFNQRQFRQRGRSRGRGRSVNYCDYDDDEMYFENFGDNDYVYDDDNVYSDNGNYDVCEMFDQCRVSEILTCKAESNDNDYWYVNMNVNDETLQMIIDTGAMCNVITTTSLLKLRVNLQNVGPSQVMLKGFNGKTMKAYGTIVLNCSYKGMVRDIEFQIINDDREFALLGKQECVNFDLVRRVNNVNENSNSDLSMKYKDVFSDTVGCVPGEVNIKLNPEVEPIVCPARPIPAAIRSQVKKELDHLENCGIIKKVTEPTQWVNPMVCVRKSNGRIRLCIDPFQLNKAILREHFPMSSIDDICTRLNGSQYFSVLDANMGYYQLKLNEQSSFYTTFNTPFGRYRHLRMAMGISSAPEIFQRVMSDMFSEIDGVEVVMDDILIHGRTLDEHNARLESVLQKARKCNLKLNDKKSKLCQREVKYLGHIITGNGLKPSPDRITGIVEMKRPENIAELESWLGMVAYVSKFIPNLSEVNSKLRELKTQKVWNWTNEHEKAFCEIKSLLTNAPVLKFYDVKQPVLVSVDASSKGLGAAIMQNDRIIAYASRALTPTEQKYAQIEKEMLAVVFGCLRFHKYIYAKSDVTVHSDHKPLESLLKKPIHNAPLRIQKMMLKLQPYTFKLMYVKGKAMGLADCLSRLSVRGNPQGDECIEDDLMVCFIETLAGVNFDKLVNATNDDCTLQVVRKYIVEGWPDQRSDVNSQAVVYWDVRDELSCYNGIVFRGERVCIPECLRSEMLESVHRAHTGMVKTKQLARDIIYWPGMAKQIQDMVSKCGICLEKQNKQAKEPLRVHPLPSRMWEKVGCDLFVYESQNYMVLVDYYSGFIEVERLDTITSFEVIEKLKSQIARYGIMDVLITDGGTQFTSQEFQEFRLMYGFHHNVSSPEHQQANGLAENSVKQMKTLLAKVAEDGSDFYLALLSLRNVPRNDVIGSPAQRLMSRRTRTTLPTATAALQPKVIDPGLVKEQLSEMRNTQKYYYDQHCKTLPEIRSGDGVRIRTKFGWKPAEYLSEHEMPRSHIVKSGNQAREFRRNRRDLLRTREKPHIVKPRVFVPRTRNLEKTVVNQPREELDRSSRSAPETPNLPVQSQKESIQTKPVSNESQTTRSVGKRMVNKPKWLKDYVST